MASKALHASWRRSTSCGGGWISRQMNAPPLRFAAGEPGRSSTFRTFDRECSPHLPLLAGELLVGTHAAPSPVALFGHMVLSIAPAVASNCASYVRLISRFADSYVRKGRRGGWGQQRLFVMSLNKLRGRLRRRNSPLWSF